MKSFVGIAAVSSVLSGANALKGALKWSRDQDEPSWSPARQTDLAYMPLIGGVRVGVEAPAPTQAPDVDVMKLIKRTSTDNTCAYVGGDTGMLSASTLPRSDQLIDPSRYSSLLQPRLSVCLQLSLFQDRLLSRQLNQVSCLDNLP